LLTSGAVIVPQFEEAAAILEMVRLVNDSDYRHRLGKAAEEYAQGEFTWSAVAEKYLNIYQS